MKLIVTQPFGTHKKGDEITDSVEILAILGDERAFSVVVVNTDGMPPGGGGETPGGGVTPGPGLPTGGMDFDLLQRRGGSPVWVAAQQVITEQLQSMNFAPNVPDVNVTAPEDSHVTGNVLSGASTITGSLKVLDYTVPTVSVPAGIKYTAGVSSTTNPLGTFRMNQDGSWVLDARMYSSGAMPTIRYTVTNGLTTTVGTLQFYLTWLNHAPVTNPDSLTTTQNTAVSVNVLANDVEWDGQSMTVTKINGATATPGGTAIAITNGTAALAANGANILVTPSAGFTGLLTFNYSVSDSLGIESVGVVYVTVAETSASGTSNWITNVATTIAFNFAGNPIAKNAIVQEPTTGATIKRITDVTQDMPGQTALYNAYSRYPTENVTGEYCLAFAGNSTSCLVIDRSSGAVVATLAYDNTGLPSHTIGAYHEVRWHYTMAHPYRVYFVRGQQFWMIDDVRNQNATRTMIKDFSTVIDWSTTPDSDRKIYMDQEGNSSLDSDHWAWMASFYDTSTGLPMVRAYVHYKVSTDHVDLMYPPGLNGFPRLPGGETGLVAFRHKPNAVEMTPDGTGILIGSDRAYPGKFDAYVGTCFEAPYIWPIDFNPATATPFRISADATHSGWSSVGGVWHFVCQDNRRDKWCATPISGANKGYGNDGYLDVNAALGAGVIDFHTDGGFYPGMHFALCTNAADGWTLVSTYSTQGCDTYGLGNALYMMKLVPEASTVKWHIAPTCNQYPAADKQDYNESPGSINLAGTRVYTCGDWNGTFPRSPVAGDPPGGPYSGPTYIDLFSIELPTNWASHFTPTAPTVATGATISGTATQGQTLTAVHATFLGFPSPTVSGNWQRDGVDIIGAAGLTYLLGAADVGHVIRFRSTATNASGSVNSFSSATAAVAGLPIPVKVTDPSIAGSAQEGATLTGSDGTWTNSPTSWVRRWLRDGVAISGATGTTYTQVSADIGHQITYEVTPSNAYGSAAPATSAATATVVANPGTISRVNNAVSTDPSPGSNVVTRNAAAFDAVAGNLIVVSVDWNTNAGVNTGVTVTDTAGNTYVAGSVVAHTGLYGRCQQFWCLSSVAQTGNVVTATNASTSTPLNVSVVQYTASSGTAWTHTGEATVGTDYVANPVTSPSFDMAANSVAVSHWFDLYGISGSIATADTVVHQVSGASWTMERIRGNAATGQSVTASCTGNTYTRTAASVQVFHRS